MCHSTSAHPYSVKYGSRYVHALCLCCRRIENMLCISLVVLNCHKADRLAREAGRFAQAQSEILTFETRKQDQTGAYHKSS